MPNRPTDADLMRGGPGDPNAGTPPAPQHGEPAPYDGPDADQRRPAAAAPAASTVRVRMDGVEYEVPAALADAWRKERDAIAGRAGSRIQQLEQRLAVLEQDDEPEDPRVASGIQPPDPRNLDPGNDAYDPGKYHRDNMAWQQYLVASSLEQVEARRHEEAAVAANHQHQAQEWQRMVTVFYRENPELRGNEDIVDAVWRNNFGNLKDLPPDEGFAKLATLSKHRLVQLTEAGKRVTARRAPTLETSSGARANRAREVEEPVNETAHGGLSAVIRAKNKRFRNPNFGKGVAA